MQPRRLSGGVKRISIRDSGSSRTFELTNDRTALPRFCLCFVHYVIFNFIIAITFIQDNRTMSTVICAPSGVF